MRAREVEISRLLDQGGGAVRRADHPALAGSLDRLLRDGRLTALLPGVYGDAARCADLGVRLAALRAWRPDAVVSGRAAAQLLFWPELRVGAVEAAAPGLRGQRAGFVLRNRRVDPDEVVERHGLRCTSPALTALDLCDEEGGAAVDAVLRSRQARLADLHRVLAAHPDRRGNQRRRALLRDSRDEPWSEAERIAHALLRRAGIGGWSANRPVVVHGTRYYVDIAFDRERLVLEIDGWEFHGSRAAFEQDRARQNDLVLAGWRVLRFTWAMLTEDPDAVVVAVLAALR
ncbi:DUF559 domain-containing protein [Microlunatus capsulatus]|uniref:Very-short-patch-repair endonuclease n=1 Tax=Microlunatus capsulatus TaxID=99117 RepID=A0ABS4Z301_9ACTN|nr:DUF559 domain-containing protein [Microlunatus capsulatus]MBP2415427.1 very-short-patch-repair endonuclease [Microlunatus capsulatus]